MTTGGQAVVDIGKSGLRIALTRSGKTVRAETTVGISTGDVGDLGAETADRVRAVVRSLDPAIGDDDRLDSVAIGANIEYTEAERTSLTEGLLGGSVAERLAICDDGTLAHGALLGTAGTLLAVGTGVIAIARTPAGAMSRFDGWGPLAGDRGGATDLGRRSLVLAFETVDTGTSTSLRASAEAHFGSLNAATGRDLVLDPGWPQRIASFAPRVSELARDGDRDGLALIQTSVDQLLMTAHSAATRAGVPTVAVSGRFGRSEPLWSRLRAALDASGMAVCSESSDWLDMDVDSFIATYRSQLDVRSR